MKTRRQQAKFNILSIPTLLLFNKGEVVATQKSAQCRKSHLPRFSRWPAAGGGCLRSESDRRRVAASAGFLARPALERYRFGRSLHLVSIDDRRYQAGEPFVDLIATRYHCAFSTPRRSP